MLLANVKVDQENVLLERKMSTSVRFPFGETKAEIQVPDLLFTGFYNNVSLI